MSLLHHAGCVIIDLCSSLLCGEEGGALLRAGIADPMALFHAARGVIFDLCSSLFFKFRFVRVGSLFR